MCSADSREEQSAGGRGRQPGTQVGGEIGQRHGNIYESNYFGPELGETHGFSLLIRQMWVCAYSSKAIRNPRIHPWLFIYISTISIPETIYPISVSFENSSFTNSSHKSKNPLKEEESFIDESGYTKEFSDQVYTERN